MRKSAPPGKLAPLLPDDEQLRRAVLNQVREIKELNKQLGIERAKNRTLEERVAFLEHQLVSGSGEPALAARSVSGTSLNSPRNASPRSGVPSSDAAGRKGQYGILTRTGLRKTAPAAPRPTAASAVQQPVGSASLDYPAAILVLRLLERSEIAVLGQTCHWWHGYAHQYLSEWRRTRLVLELGDTERTYLQNMHAIVEAYIIPGQVGSKVLDNDESFRLFANTRALYRATRHMYTMLRSVLLQWNKDSCIGVIFQAFQNAPELYRTYSANQTDALAFAEQLRFELRINDNDWRLLESFLIQPIQRIPRYQMLLREVGQNTAAKHEEHRHIAEALTLLNSAGREMEQAMEEDATAKIGEEMMGLIENAPSWMTLLKLLKYAQIQTKRGRKEVDAFLMLFGHCIALCEVHKSLLGKKNAGLDSSASVSAPLGKDCEALRKQWKFVGHYSRAVLKWTPAADDATIVIISTTDHDSATLQFPSAASVHPWTQELK